MNTLTGAGSIHAPSVLSRAKLAVDEINAAGGVLGSRVFLEIEDNHTEVDISIQKATNLVKDTKVAAMIDMSFSNQCIAVATQVAEPLKTIYISVTLVVIGAMVYLFLFTDYGLRVRAVIANCEMAAAVGINTSLVDQSVFALGAALAGLAGAVMSPVVAVNLNMGLEYFARTFHAVIVGGVNSIFGVVAGGLIIGSGEGILSAAFRPVVAQILVLVLATVVVCIRPQGVVGEVM